MLALTPSVQSPAAYAERNLRRAGLRSRLEDAANTYEIAPAEIDEGLTDADLAFGHAVGNVLRYGASGDGATNPAADDTAAAQAALNVAARIRGRVHFPAKPDQAETVYIVDSLFVASGVLVTADDGVIIERKAGATAYSNIFHVEGVIDDAAAVALTVEAYPNNRQVKVGDNSTFQPGQIVVIRDDKEAFTSGARNMEFNEVESTDPDGETIHLKRRIIGRYEQAENAEIMPMATEARGVRFRNVHCRIPTGEKGGGFYFNNAYGCKVEDCECEGQEDQAGVLIWRSAFVNVWRFYGHDGQAQSTSGYGYGSSIGNSSHHCNIYDSHFSNVRENSLSNGVRHCGYTNCEVWSAYDNAFNSHGDGVTDCHFTNCRSYFSRSKGFTVATTYAPDKRIRFVNCKSHYSGYMGFMVLGASGANHEDIQFINCEVRAPGQLDANSYGFYLEYATRPRLVGCGMVDGGANVLSGAMFSNCVAALMDGGEVRQLTNTWPVRYTACTGLEIRGVKCANHGANEAFHTQGADSTGVWIHHCDDDQDVIPTLPAGGRLEAIKLPTVRLEARGVETVKDGDTIAHGLGTTPTGVIVTSATADRAVSANTFGSSTFKVNINTTGGVADSTPQQVSWIAWK